MTDRGIDPALRERVALGQYNVDLREVAEAVMRSWMLEPAEAVNGPVAAEQDEVASG